MSVSIISPTYSIIQLITNNFKEYILFMANLASIVEKDVWFHNTRVTENKCKHSCVLHVRISAGSRVSKVDTR